MDPTDILGIRKQMRDFLNGPRTSEIQISVRTSEFNDLKYSEPSLAVQICLNTHTHTLSHTHNRYIYIYSLKMVGVKFGSANVHCVL